VNRWLGSIMGLLLAALPAAAMATEEGRALDPPADMGTVLLVTIVTLLGLALVGGIGYLYRRERGLDWDFQKPDAPDHH
jgi:membrane protease YdiL (CAAX protease family)